MITDPPDPRNPTALAVIIGRAGSKGLPGKNARPLAGRPLICHTIGHALAAATIDRIIVSTDGAAIAAAAASMNVEVIDRPAALADDHATVDAAVRHAVAAAGDEHGIIVILYANVPLRPDGLIDRAVRTLIETGADSVQSYCPVGKYHPHWMVRLGDDGRIRPNVSPVPHRRQDLPAMFLPDGGVIAVTRESLFDRATDEHGWTRMKSEEGEEEFRGATDGHGWTQMKREDGEVGKEGDEEKTRHSLFHPSSSVSIRGSTLLVSDPHAFLGSDRRGIETRPGEVIDIDDEHDLALAESILRRRAEIAAVATV